MTQMKFFSWNSFFALITFLFGVLICQYTGNRGVFPIDSFSHFDTGYRILNGEHPFKDYWIVSGLFVDYLQSIIFYLFGINWQTYVLNASLLNGCVSLLVYSLLNNLGLNIKLSFFYAICFSILAYPSSGTPFVDHHSALLSVSALILLIKAINTNKLYIWFFVPVFLFAAFLSKQVPATYIFFVVILLITLHFTHQTKKDFFRIFITLAASSTMAVTLLAILFYMNDIDMESFLTQYLYYPVSIGEERYQTINYDLKNSFLNFKFIYLALFFLILFSYENLKQKNKNFYKDINFKILIICILSFISLAQHIIFTKNQIFIFFLIPLYLGIANIQLNKSNKKYKKYLNIFLIIFCIGITLKYHYRFNLERKFHEFDNVNFNKAIDASHLNKKFSGLKWISPNYKTNDEILLEINFLKSFNDILKLDKQKKIVLSNYSLFSVLVGENISGFSRWYPGDNSAYPKKGNKYFENFKDLIISSFKKKKIRSIYILPDIAENNLLDYVDSKCFNRRELQLKIIKYEINDKCNDLFIWKKN
jgi:hypothetical protein